LARKKAKEKRTLGKRLFSSIILDTMA